MTPELSKYLAKPRTAHSSLFSRTSFSCWPTVLDVSLYSHTSLYDGTGTQGSCTVGSLEFFEAPEEGGGTCSRVGAGKACRSAMKSKVAFGPMKSRLSLMSRIDIPRACPN